MIFPSWDMNLVQTFLRVAETRSYTKAAEILGVPKSTVSRRIQDLEARLGERLLERSTRSLGLTASGEAFFQQVQPLLSNLIDAVEDFKSKRDRLAGTLAICAPVEFGQHYLAPCIRAFQKAHPDVDFQVRLGGELPDLIGQGIDVAVVIRTAPLPDSSTLTCRALGPSPRVMVASPQYIRENGLPKTIADVEKSPLIVFQDEWPWMLRSRATGEIISLKSQLKVATNNATFARRMAIEGMGLTLVPWLVAEEQVEKGLLQKVLLDWDPKPAQVLLLTPSRQSGSVRRQHFAQFLFEWVRTQSDYTQFPKDIAW